MSNSYNYQNNNTYNKVNSTPPNIPPNIKPNVVIRPDVIGTIHLIQSQTLENITPYSLYNVSKSGITITLPTMNNIYTNFTIINSSNDFITITTNNTNELLYNSLYIHSSGENNYYLKKNKMVTINNFYDSNNHLAWLLILS